jgi:hypothetical protein
VIGELADSAIGLLDRMLPTVVLDGAPTPATNTPPGVAGLA